MRDGQNNRKKKKDTFRISYCGETRSNDRVLCTCLVFLCTQFLSINARSATYFNEYNIFMYLAL